MSYFNIFVPELKMWYSNKIQNLINMINACDSTKTAVLIFIKFARLTDKF